MSGLGDAERIVKKAEEERRHIQSLLPEAAEFFHQFEGEMFERGEAVEELSKELEIDEELANRLIAGLVADEVDPIVQVMIGRERHVGIIDYEENGYYYSFTDWDDVEEEQKVSVCVQCVKEEEFDQDVFRVEGGEEELLKEHLREEHDLSPRDVETGASLLSGTTIAGNIEFHTGNDGKGSGLDADMLHGNHASNYVHLEPLIGTNSYIYNTDPPGKLLEQIDLVGPSGYGVDIDSDGNIWVADSGDQTIRMYRREGSASTVELLEVSSPAERALGLGVNSDDCIWVVMDNDLTIYRLDRSGTVQSQFDTPGSRPRGIDEDSSDSLWHADDADLSIYNLDQQGDEVAFTGFEAPGTAPHGVAVDSNDSIWTTDTVRNEVYRHDNSGSILGSFTAPSSSPRGIGVDDRNCLWLVDGDDNSDLSVYKLDQSGEFQSQFDAPWRDDSEGLGVDSDGSVWIGNGFDGSIARVKPLSRLYREFSSPGSNPRGLGIDSQDCIWNTDSSGSIYRLKALGLGDRVSEIGTPSETPRGVAVDSDGSVWSVDEDNDAEGIYRQDQDGSNITYTKAPDTEPEGLAIDSSDCIWSTDGFEDSIYKMKRTLWDKKISSPSVSPAGVEIDSSGCIWNADSVEDKIYRMDKSGNVESTWNAPVSTIEGLGIDGSSCFWMVAFGEDSPGKIAKATLNGDSFSIIDSFAAPSEHNRGIAIDSSTQCIWHSTSVNEGYVWEIDQSGNVTSSFTAPSAYSTGPGIDSQGCIWFPENYTESIYKVDKSGSIVDQIETRWNAHQGLAFDSNDCMWVTDWDWGEIYKIPQENRLRDTIPQPDDAVDGIGIDPSGGIWNSTPDSIYKIDSNGSQLATIGTQGQARGIFIDSQGCIWQIDDTSSGSLHKLDQSGSLLESIDPPGRNPWGIGGDSSHFWISDTVDLSIYQIGQETGSRITDSFNSPVSSSDPQGLGIDTDTGCLWHADSSSGSIHKIDQTGHEIAGSAIAAPGSSPRGLGVDTDNCIWISDAATDPGSIYQLNRLGTTLLQFESPSSGTTGVGIGPDNSLWHVDSTSEKVYQLSKTATVQFEPL